MSRTRSALAALAAGTLAVGGLLAVAAPSSAQSAEPARAASYVNPDTGAASENPDVDPGSSCETPDQADMQPTGDPATGENNVHNDACLFDAAGNPVDVPAAFELIGPAQFSGCPDPDGDGPKTATNNGNQCLLGGFEADNTEYHARIVGTGAGIAQVTFCADPEGNGCADATVSDRIVLTFQGAGQAATSGPAATGAATPAGAVAAGEAPLGDDLPLLPVAAVGAAALAGSVLWSRRRT